MMNLMNGLLAGRVTGAGSVFSALLANTVMLASEMRGPSSQLNIAPLYKDVTPMSGTNLDEVTLTARSSFFAVGNILAVCSRSVMCQHCNSF
jgi:hypothetical protein